MKDTEPHAHLSEAEVSSTQVYRGKLLEVRWDRVRLPDGHESTREYVVHPGAVVVIAVLDNGELLLERQFRYPLRRAFLEFPAGIRGMQPTSSAAIAPIRSAGAPSAIKYPFSGSP